ncbi:MAG: rRNA maturation RNase YbeY [Gammaproteobacteria bacterium]
MNTGGTTAEVEVQYAVSREWLPGETEIRRWAQVALEQCHRAGGEMVVRLTDEAESARLNEQYRHKPGPTNVLSFPFEPPAGVPVDHLGDLVISVPVVEREAGEQGKPLEAHLAHMVVHGTLHLLGYDHLEEADAQEMERLEIAILGQLGYDDPYRL